MLTSNTLVTFASQSLLNRSFWNSLMVFLNRIPRLQSWNVFSRFAVLNRLFWIVFRVIDSRIPVRDTYSRSLNFSNRTTIHLAINFYIFRGLLGWYGGKTCGQCALDFLTSPHSALHWAYLSEVVDHFKNTQTKNEYGPPFWMQPKALNLGRHVDSMSTP